MPILKQPQRFTVCDTCEEIIEYDPNGDPSVIQIVHSCGKVVKRRDSRGAEYQYLLEAGMGHRIAWEVVFRVPSLSPATRMAIIKEREKEKRRAVKAGAHNMPPAPERDAPERDAPPPEEPPPPQYKQAALL